MAAHKSPEFKSNLLSTVLYSWITGFAIKLYRECFSAEDLYPIDDRLSSALVTKQLEDDWTREQKQNPSPSSLVKCLWNSFGGILIWASLCLLCSEICNQLVPFVIECYLSSIAERPEDIGLLAFNRENLTGYGACLLLVLLPTLKAITNNVCMRLTMFAAIQSRTAMSGMIYERVIALQGESKSSYSVGTCVSLVSSDTLRIENFFNFIHLVWQTPLQIICSTVMLYIMLGWSAFPGVAMLLFGLPIQLFAVRMLYVYRKKIADLTDKRLKLFQEMLHGARVIKLNSWEDVFLKKLGILRMDEMKSVRRFHLASGLSVVVTLVFPAMCSVVGYGTYFLSGHEMKNSLIFAAIVYFNMFETPLLNIPVAINAAISAKGAVLRLDKFLKLSSLGDYFKRISDMSNDFDTSNNTVIEILNASFEWENSSPSTSIDPSIPTPPRDADYYSTLSNITLNVPQGSLVAIVGPVGCGKSSLLHAIMGEMKQSSGIVKIKRGMKISYCPQSAWILNDTVRENICFGTPFQEDYYWKVVSQCALNTDLDSFPFGDQTEIGERGIGLSGGQKARVNLARAAYSSADIVLIDDPMSAVDARVRNTLFNKCILDGVMKNATRLLVTHNLAVLPYVDHVVVLREGAILEQGTYDHLIQTSQYFNELMTKYYGEEEIVDDDENPLASSSLPVLIAHSSSITALQSPPNMTTGNKCNRYNQQQQPDLTEFEENLASSSSATTASSEILNMKKQGGIADGNCLSMPKTLHRPKLAKAGFKAYMRYGIMAGGFLFLFIAIVANIIHEFARCYKDIWLESWTDNAYSLSGFVYLSVYGGIGLSLIFTTWICVLTFIVGGYFASRRIHDMAATSIFRASMRFFDTTPMGRILNRFSRDMDVIDNQVAEEIYNFLYAIIQTISSLTLAFWGNGTSACVLLPPLILSIILQLIYRRCNHQTQALQVKALANLMCHFSESYLGISVIRVFRKERVFIEKYHALTNLYNRAVYLTMILRRWTGMRSEFLGGMLVGTFALSSLLLRVSPGIVGVVLTLLLVFSNSLDWLVKQFADTEMSMLSVDRLCQYAFDVSPEIYNPPNPIEDFSENKEGGHNNMINGEKDGKKWPRRGHIKFENYTAGYISGVEPILRQISIEVNPGEKVAIIGRTGAGKSTILAAIFRFIEANVGKIEIDGYDVSRIPLVKLRSSLTVVPQDPILFSGTIRFNLDPTNIFTDADIWNVIDKLNMRGFIEEMEENGSLDSEISDYGQNISLGEKQMLCVARAVLHKSKLVIMDEPTASVDLETDEKIHECLWANFSDSTVMTITHRLTHIEKYDRVLVLDHGRVVEFDTPQNLVNNPESYLSGLLKESQNVQAQATSMVSH